MSVRMARSVKESGGMAVEEFYHVESGRELGSGDASNLLKFCPGQRFSFPYGYVVPFPQVDGTKTDSRASSQKRAVSENSLAGQPRSIRRFASRGEGFPC